MYAPIETHKIGDVTVMVRDERDSIGMHWRYTVTRIGCGYKDVVVVDNPCQGHVAAINMLASMGA